ncbi:prepilin-type N-terminal cleavage/methylation domain-containing protein, partial [Clostridiaceae bacterium HSG29]|nr:prepilin-type N-terminal cleavage/methylation domain-containing protein [Clostridiaceae bacterium HSG29]
MNNKGFTLIELIIVIALTGIVMVLATNSLFFSSNTFHSTSDQQSIQSDSRIITTFIENEISYASSIEILENAPGTFDDTKKYIYLDEINKKIMYKNGSAVSTEINTV